MVTSRAEIVANDVVQEWRFLALTVGQPSADTMRTGRELVLTLVAQGLVAEVVSGLVDGEGHEGESQRLSVALRWRFVSAPPPLEVASPFRRLHLPGARFVLWLKPSPAWLALPRAAGIALEADLPMEVRPGGPQPVPAGELQPVFARRLPEGDYLIRERLLAPHSSWRRNFWADDGGRVHG